MLKTFRQVYLFSHSTESDCSHSQNLCSNNKHHDAEVPVFYTLEMPLIFHNDINNKDVAHSNMSGQKILWCDFFSILVKLSRLSSVFLLILYIFLTHTACFNLPLCNLQSQ